MFRKWKKSVVWTRIAQLVKKGKVPGMTLSVGKSSQTMLALNDDDLLTSNHRGLDKPLLKEESI